MTLAEAKILLTKNNICFEQNEYKNEKEFLERNFQFDYGKSTSPFAIIVLLIRSNNGKMHLGLQFCQKENNYIFNDLFFGGYFYEMFDYNENMLSKDLIDNIKVAISGKQCVIYVTNLKNRKWYADSSFFISEDPVEDDTDEYLAAIRRIEQPKSLIEKFMRTKKKYEIYNWNNYRCIIK